MKKKIILIVVVLAVLLLSVLCIVLGKGSAAPAETTEPTVETTEETIPGVAKSIFDEDYENTEPAAHTEPTQETTPATVPEAAPGGDSTDGNGGSDGRIEAPEAPNAGGSQSTPTQPTGGTPDPSQPTETPTQNEESALSEYERFINMTPAEQQAYMESFESIEAFFEWYNQAKAEYEAANPPIEVGDGNIDLGDYE